MAPKYATELDFLSLILLSASVRTDPDREDIMFRTNYPSNWRFTRSHLLNDMRSRSWSVSLSLRTFNRCFKEYRTDGIFREVGKKPSTGGRPETIYEINWKKLRSRQGQRIKADYAQLILRTIRQGSVQVFDQNDKREDFPDIFETREKRREIWELSRRLARLMAGTQRTQLLVIGPCYPGLGIFASVARQPPIGLDTQNDGVRP